MADTSYIELDSSYEDTGEPPPKRPLLESVGACFQQNRLERERRIAKEETKREAEKVHAKLIQDTACPTQLAKASYVVGTWAKVHGVKPDPKRKRNLPKHNNLTVTSASSSFRNPVTDLTTRPTLTASRATVIRKKCSTPSPSDILNISDLSIGTPESAEVRNSRETGCSPVLDCDSDNLTSFNKNQSSSGSEKENQPASSSSHSVSNRNNKSDSSQPVGNRQNQTSSNCDNQSSSNCDNQSDSNQNDQSTSGNKTNQDLDSSLIIVSGENTPSSPAKPKQYMCHVIHCQTVFTSREKLNHHHNQFRHSPCNPCLRAKDGKLPPDPVCHMCPKCDLHFMTDLECRSHMQKEDHMPYLPPLKIAGYICPQCLAIFENFETCWNHITEMSHRFVSYPFADDLKGPQPPEVGPVAIPEELAMDFIDKCKRVPFKVECLECSLEIETALMLRQHMAETNRQHPVSSLCDSNPIDIFADYLAEYQCSMCCRLFTKYVPTHYCARGIEGTLIENNVKSFHSFVKSCALTLTPVDPESSSSTDCAVPGPKPSLVFENLMESVRHSPEKGPIPKLPHTVANKKACSSNPSQGRPSTSHNHNTPQGKQSKDKKLENANEEIIILDTSPGPEIAKSGKGKSVTIQKGEQTDIYGVRKCENPKYLVFKLDTTKAANSKKESGHYMEMPSTSGVYSCETKFQNMVNVITAVSPPGSTTDLSFLKGCVPEGSEAEPSVRRATQVARDDDKRGDRSKSPGGKSSEQKKSFQPDPCRERSRSPVRPHPTSTENLVKMKNIIFLDLDNWPGFFSKLPRSLPDLTFVWGFYGGKMNWKEPSRCLAFNTMKTNNTFYLHDRCGHTKDAADFAIVLTVGQMHERLPKHIHFTIVSGDKGFIEVERQMLETKRRAVVIDPHKAQQFCEDMIYTMVTSVSDT